MSFHNNIVFLFFPLSRSTTHCCITQFFTLFPTKRELLSTCYSKIRIKTLTVNVWSHPDHLVLEMYVLSNHPWRASWRREGSAELSVNARATLLHISIHEDADLPKITFYITVSSSSDIRSSWFTNGVVDTGGKWKKSSIRKCFTFLLGTFG